MNTLTGAVAGADPEVVRTVHGPRGPEFVTAVVDTGMQAAVQLPLALLERHRRGRFSRGYGRLADDSVSIHKEAVVEVELCGERHRVVAEGLGSQVLIGMGLLLSHRLTVDCVEGGPVTIEPLPR